MRPSLRLKVAVKGGGIGDKCRFLTGGDAEVAIWEKLWGRNVWQADRLSYDILLCPHHCSWHSLSRDSWSELREKGEVSEDALNALSQARDGATILASSNPIEDDDNDPPCIGAKRVYDVIAEGVAGYRLRRDEQDETGASIRVRRAAVAWNGGRA